MWSLIHFRSVEDAKTERSGEWFCRLSSKAGSG